MAKFIGVCRCCGRMFDMIQSDARIWDKYCDGWCEDLDEWEYEHFWADGVPTPPPPTDADFDGRETICD